MLDQILSVLGISDASFNSAGVNRRVHARLPGIQTDVEINGRIYSVRDWSLSGMFFDTPPDTRMIVGDKINFTVRFRLPHETVTINHTAHIVRSAARGLAVEYTPLSAEVRRQFDKVIDGFHAQSFLESQIAA